MSAGLKGTAALLQVKLSFHCGNSGITLLSAITELSLSSNEWIPKPRPVNQSTTMRFHILRTFEGLFGNWASSCCSAVRGILKVLENWRMAKLMKFKLCVEWLKDLKFFCGQG